MKRRPFAPKSHESAEANPKRRKKPSVSRPPADAPSVAPAEAADAAPVLVAPAWERTRFFAAPKPPKSSLPTIHENGAIKRAPSSSVLLRPPPRPTDKPAASSSSAAAGARKKVTLPPAPVSKPPTFQRSKSLARLPSSAPAAPSAPAEKKPAQQLSAAAVQRAKRQLAALASQIVTDPAKNYAKLTELRQLTIQHKRGKLSTLALLTEAQVYKDVLPGYRIRAITEKERESKVSKEMASLRTFEQALLASYTRFVKACVSGAQMRCAGNLDTPAARDMTARKVAACKALCLLLEAVPHFNDVDTVVAPAIVTATTDKMEAVREVAATGIANVLCDAHRASGFALDTCVALAKGLAGTADSGRKARIISEQSVAPLAEIRFDAFATLPIGKQGEKDPRKGKRMSKRKREMMEKKMKKVRDKDEEKMKQFDYKDDQVDKDMQEAQADATPEELLTARKAMLNAVCTACFNVIKEASSDILMQPDQPHKAVTAVDPRHAPQESSKCRKPPPALSVALKGVLNVCKFLSSDVIDAIIAALVPMLSYSARPGSTVRQYPLGLRFRCATVAYEICTLRNKNDVSSARAAARNGKKGTDPNEGLFETDTHALDNALYAMLAALPQQGDAALPDEEALVFDAIEAVYACIHSGRRLPAARAAALARRLASLALGAAVSHTCAIGLAKCAQLVLDRALLPPPFMLGGGRRNDEGDDKKNARMQLDDWQGEQQQYDEKAENVDLTNAAHSVAWDLFAMQHYFHPAVRDVAAQCARGMCGPAVPKQTQNPVLFAKNFIASEGGFNPLPQETLHLPAQVSQPPAYNVAHDRAVRAMLAHGDGKFETHQLVEYGTGGIDHINLKGKDNTENDNDLFGHYFQNMYEQNGASDMELE